MFDARISGRLGKEGAVAFVTRNKALCLHVTKWLYLRLEQRLHDSDEAKTRIEGAFRVLFSPFEPGLRRVRIDLDQGYVAVDDVAAEQVGTGPDSPDALPNVESSGMAEPSLNCTVPRKCT